VDIAAEAECMIAKVEDAGLRGMLSRRFVVALTISR
jgi:hypothetical protein